MKTSFLIAKNPFWLASKRFLFGLCAIALAGFAGSGMAIELEYAVFGDGDGSVYAISSATGKLNWYQHTGRMAGAVSWANGGTPKVVGNGWSTGINKVFSGGAGVIYVIDGNGNLRWYRHDGRFTGTAAWLSNQGTVLGPGWGSFAKVFSGGDGVIYAITTDGRLLWYRHKGWLTGDNSWAPGGGNQISRGWNAFAKVFSGDDGVIYSIQTDGVLRWYRHEGRLDGTSWATDSGVVVGSGWQVFKQVFSSGDGIIYATAADGKLFWYRHTGWLTGANSWVSLTGTQIGLGWLFP